MEFEKIINALNELAPGGYIRIRDGKHQFLGWIRNHALDRYIEMMGGFHLTMIELIEEKKITIGDTLYRIGDISSVQAKPLIYL